jgi:hypothetical protein
MEPTTEINLGDLMDIKNLTEEHVRLRLRHAVLLLPNVNCGARIVFKCNSRHMKDVMIEGGYVPYLENEPDTPVRNVYSLQLVPRAPPIPPPPIVFDIDEVELLIHKSRDPALGGDDDFELSNELQDKSFAHLVDATMVHFQMVVNECEPFKVRAPDRFRLEDIASSRGWIMDFLILLVASSFNHRYITTIIQLHMDYMHECNSIDRTFSRRVLAKYGFGEDEEDDAFKHMYRVMWAFRALFLKEGLKMMHPQQVAMQVLNEFLTNHPKMAAATEKSFALSVWLSNEYKCQRVK